jgi:hypothetical protein
VHLLLIERILEEIKLNKTRKSEMADKEKIHTDLNLESSYNKE